MEAGKEKNRVEKRPREEASDGGSMDVIRVEVDLKRKRGGKKHKNREKDEDGDDQKRSKDDPFPGRAPLDPAALSRHTRGEGVRTERVKTKYQRKLQERREERRRQAEELAARADQVLKDGDEEEGGFLEGDRTDEFTAQVTQTQIRAAVDAESAAKGFELNLGQFGPYKLDYTRNGRFLLLGGRRGHVAALEWTSKRLLCEVNVQESVHDVQWLHTENLFAVAQKRWTYIYDNQGIEIHCLKKLDNVQHLEFLPYHFLLAAGSERGFLSWVDVSVGKIVSQFGSRLGPSNVMCQNPWNAVLCLGHNKGTVTMWTPNVREPVAKMLAHRQPVRAVAVDGSGRYMATAATDRSLKIWDVRQFKCLQDYRISSGASRLDFSGRGLLGVAAGSTVEIYKDCCTKAVEHPYLTHRVHRSVSDMSFVPFEDVMGIGHEAGFASILSPGSGRASYDAYEVNPYQSKTQRREAEVRQLLEKVRPELISLDPEKIGEVDAVSAAEGALERAKKISLKPSEVKDFEPRSRSGGRGGTAKRYHVKKTVVAEGRMREIREKLVEATEAAREGKQKKKKAAKPILDRLK